MNFAEPSSLGISPPSSCVSTLSDGLAVSTTWQGQWARIALHLTANVARLIQILRGVRDSKPTGRSNASLYIDSEGAKHRHGPESSENACYKCDCDFPERETLLGEAAGRET